MEQINLPAGFAYITEENKIHMSEFPLYSSVKTGAKLFAVITNMKQTSEGFFYIIDKNGDRHNVVLKNMEDLIRANELSEQFDLNIFLRLKPILNQYKDKPSTEMDECIFATLLLMSTAIVANKLNWQYISGLYADTLIQCCLHIRDSLVEDSTAQKIVAICNWIKRETIKLRDKNCQSRYYPTIEQFYNNDIYQNINIIENSIASLLFMENIQRVEYITIDLVKKLKDIAEMQEILDVL